MTITDDYVLGTHDQELARLGLQHRVWRSRALDAWTRVGFTAGQTLLDVGCGPGYAALDLAEIAGAGGRVVAVDRSARFLDALRSAAVRNGLTNITARQVDLDADALPVSVRRFSRNSCKPSCAVGAPAAASPTSRVR
ncbi:MAG: methyltransferase domain-containing protein [Acidobacteriota bacterium]